MKYKAIIKATTTMVVLIDEDINGNQEVEEVGEVMDIDDFEVIDKIG